MKARLLTAIAGLVAWVAMTGRAEAWECAGGSANYNASCYVSFVEVYTADSGDSDAYILAKISDPLGITACNYIKVQKGSACASPTVETIKMSEMVFLTALTTQLPIKFETYTSSGDVCCVSAVMIQKPEN